MPNKPNIIIPNLFNIKYGKLLLANKPKEPNQKLNTFTNKEANYNLTINQGKKYINDISVTSGIFNYLNVQGDLTVNVLNNSHFNLSFYADKNISFNSYSNADYLSCNKLILNTPESIKLNINCNHTNYCPIKEIEINSPFFEILLYDLEELEKLKINSDHQKLSEIRSWHTEQNINIEGLDNLKELDLSGIKNSMLDSKNLILKKLPKNCIIKFDKDMKIRSSNHPLNNSCKLKTIFGYEPYDYSDSKIFDLKDLCKNYIKNDIIEISYIDFKKIIYEASNKATIEQFNSILEQEKKLLEKEEQEVKTQTIQKGKSYAR